jgi:hypothetical protein
MDTTTHRTLSDLFDQLGLPSDDVEIRAFVRTHAPLPADQTLTQASFWSDAQRAFLVEAWRADGGDWAGTVDELNVLLHAHPAIGHLPDA